MARQTVTIVHRAVTGTDQFGNDTFTETSEDIPNSIVSPPSSNEAVWGTDVVSINLQVFFPPGTSLGPLDVLLIGGDRYEVQGVPVEAVSPFTGFIAPVQVYARLVTGASA